MENELFLNTGGIPMQTMPTWQSLASSPSMEIQMNEQSPDCFFNPSWDKSTDHSGLQFDSALSSMVSSPAASNSNISNDNFVIRELIGKLGNINNTSCYSTPLNSPPKLNLPIVDNFVKEKKLPSLGNSMALNSTVAEFSSDPGFAERAAKFSRFGSRSFNGRTKTTTTTAKTQFVNPEFGFRSGNHLVINEKFPRVSSSPSLKVLGSQVKGNRNPNNEMVNCPEETSSVSEQVMNTPESGLKCSNDFNNISRKRKAVPKGKSKEPSPSPDTSKMGEANGNWRNKRMKTNEGNGNENENGASKKEEEQKGDGHGGGEEDDKQNKTSNNKNENTKPPEAPKDYIHVRARRGQATDSHSLAERVRREKISERMKLLQDLVPGCNKVTGKALMLDEIINYVQSLQRQVEFLSMKLASVNTRLDSSIDALVSKDMYEAAGNKGVGVTHPIFPIDSSATTLLGHLTHQNQPLHHINGSLSQCSASGTDPFDTTTAAAATTTSMFRNLNMHIPLHQLDQFADSIPQFQAFCEDDLQSIVQMGFGQNCNHDDPTLQSQSFHGQNQVSHTKMEL